MVFDFPLNRIHLTVWMSGMKRTGFPKGVLNRLQTGRLTSTDMDSLQPALMESLSVRNEKTLYIAQ